MEVNKFVIDLLGTLEQKKSQKQLNSDIKQIEKVINALRITGMFAQGDTKKNLNNYIKTLQSQLNHVKLTAKIDSKNLKSEVDKALNSVSFKDIDALNIDENKTKLKVKKVVADAKAYAEKNPISIGVNIDSKRSKLDNDLTAYLNKNTKINESSVLLGEADKVRDLIGAITDKKSLREATDAFQLYKSSVASVGYNTKSTTDKIKDMLSNVTKISSAFGVASMLTNNFVKSLSTLRSNDTILTEISKTSELTKRQLQELGDEAFKIASKYGQLSSDFLLATQEMARAGYDANVKDMAELSTKVQGAGDMAAKLSNQYIIATDKAFKMNGSIEALTATLDGANNITNNNALSMTDLGEAMSIVGSQAASSGMKVNETTAAVSTMIAVTQRSGSEMANAFKGILMNLQQVTGEIEDGGDAIDTESLTKYEKACAELGVSLSEVKNGVVSLREPMEIIKELSEAYTQLDKSDARRANLLSAVGGKYRANALNAILENYDMYEKMLKEYADGLGSMDEEAEKTAKSWEGRLNALSNSFTSFVNTLTNKEAVLNGISFFDRLIQGAESLVNTLGAIPTVLTAVNSSLVVLNKDYGLTKIWDKDTKKIDFEGNLFGIDISKIKNLKKHYEDAGIAISDWNCELAKGKTDLEAFESACVKNSASLKEYLSTCSKDAPASLNGYKKYLQSTGQATDEMRIKTILLNSALTLLGSLAVQTVIKGITTAIDEFNETVEEAQESVDGVNSKISDLKSQIEELNNLEYKSDFDNQKISQLEKELELQEKILEVEQKRLYQNQIGTSFSDYFDKDSLITKQQSEYDRYNKEGYKYLSVRFEADKSSLAEVEVELSSLQNRLNSGSLAGHDKFVVESDIAKLTEKRNELLKEQQSIEEQLIINSGEYLKNYQTAQEAVDSGLLTDSDLEKAKSMTEYWNQLYQDSSNIVTEIQKMNGTYDNTNDLLEGMFGGISRNDLVSLSDDDKRIALSFSPDNEIGFDELQKRIAETKGDIESLNDTPVTFTISDHEESIDNIQSTISTLRSALDSFNQGTLDESAVIDLMQQFPELIPYIDLAAEGFGNLSEGLSTLIAQQPDALIQSLQKLKSSLNTDEERAQVDALIDSLQSLTSYGDSGMEAYATTVGSTWEDTANVIESVTTQFENLAKVQEAVADGLTMSTTAAAELAQIYPEILTYA